MAPGLPSGELRIKTQKVLTIVGSGVEHSDPPDSFGGPSSDTRDDDAPEQEWTCGNDPANCRASDDPRIREGFAGGCTKHPYEAVRPDRPRQPRQRPDPSLEAMEGALAGTFGTRKARGAMTALGLASPARANRVARSARTSPSTAPAGDSPAASILEPGMRRCTGSTRYGIQAHQAPIADFPVQPSRKDGLASMCRTHWNQYTSGLARDSKARKAAILTPAQEAEIAERQAETGDGPAPLRFRDLSIGEAFSFPQAGSLADPDGYSKRSARGWTHPTYGNGTVGSIDVEVIRAA